MKTLKELNNKWYWRLIKLVYFFVLWLFLVASIWDLIQDINKTHDPEKVKIFQEEVFRQQKIVKDVLEKYPESRYSIKRQQLIDDWATTRDIRILLSSWRLLENLNYLEWYLNKDFYDREACNKSIETYLNKEMEAWPLNSFYTRNCDVRGFWEFLKELIEYKWWYDSNLYLKMKWEYLLMDTTPWKEILFVIGFSILYIIWFGVFVLLCRCMIYYVLFGTVKPKEE